MLTTLATGSSIAARRLYSQNSIVRFAGVAPQIITGICPIVNVPQTHQDLLTRIYPIHVRRKQGRERKSFGEIMEDEAGWKERFLETLGAAALVHKCLGTDRSSRHRIGMFGETLDILFPDLGAVWWMVNHFDHIERRRFESINSWLPSLLKNSRMTEHNTPWFGAASDISKLVNMDIAPSTVIPSPLALAALRGVPPKP